MKGGSVSGEEHRLAAGLLASAAEILDERLSHRFDGLAIELHRSPVVDLDENVIVLQVIERARPALGDRTGGGLSGRFGYFQRLVQYHGGGHRKEKDELKGDVDHGGEIQFLDLLSRGSRQRELGLGL